jgi:NTE family protein
VSIAINLNGDLLGRRFEAEPEASAATASAIVSNEFLDRVLSRLPAPMRKQTAQIALQLLPGVASGPGYFDVLANSINIMQDHITRTRLAGEPPHVMLLPRLRDMGLMEFDRAKEAIAEGRTCVEQALPMLRRYM